MVETTRRLTAGIAAIGGLRLLGSPKAGIFAFGSDEPDVHALADILEARGWSITQQADPDCLHCMVTPAHAQSADAFLRDLADAVRLLRADPERFAQGSAALYALLRQAPDKETAEALVTEVFNTYMAEGGAVTPQFLAGLAARIKPDGQTGDTVNGR